MSRERLPNRRAAETFDIEASGLKYTATLGFRPDGRVVEIFLTTIKPDPWQASSPAIPRCWRPSLCSMAFRSMSCGMR